MGESLKYIRIYVGNRMTMNRTLPKIGAAVVSLAVFLL